jgi:hypothetical protein
MYPPSKDFQKLGLKVGHKNAIKDKNRRLPWIFSQPLKRI